jgi:hypothetical protein
MRALNLVSLFIFLAVPNFGFGQTLRCGYEGFPGVIQGELMVCDKGQLRQYKVSEILRLRQISERMDRAMVPFLPTINIETLRQKTTLEPNSALVINGSTVNTNGYGIVTFGSDLTLTTAESLRPGDIQFSLESLMAYEQRSGN